MEHDINYVTNVNEENGNDPMDFDENTNDSDEYSGDESSNGPIEKNLKKWKQKPVECK